jgi:hypothetical protein
MRGYSNEIKGVEQNKETARVSKPVGNADRWMEACRGKLRIIRKKNKGRE